MKEETWGSLDVLTVELIDEYHEIIIFYLHKFEKICILWLLIYIKSFVSF